MINNKLRIGNFTSSEIYNLVKMGKRPMTDAEIEEQKLTNPKSRARTIECMTVFQAGGESYINKKANETRMGKSFDVGAYSQSLAWGEIMEMFVFSELGLEYKPVSKGTVLHPTINGWSGTCDAEKFKNGDKFAVAEIKCYWPENFANYVNVLMEKDVDLLREKFPKEYWQIVSNSCILGLDYGEAICFMPYESQMNEIRESIETLDSPHQWRYRFVVESDNWQLPVLPDKGYYKSMNKFEFEIPKSDKEYINERVKEAVKQKNELLK